LNVLDINGSAYSPTSFVRCSFDDVDKTGCSNILGYPLSTPNTTSFFINITNGLQVTYAGNAFNSGTSFSLSLSYTYIKLGTIPP